MTDPRNSSSYSVVPQLQYNTVSGVNGPLVIVENVWPPFSLLNLGCRAWDWLCRMLMTEWGGAYLGQIPAIQ